MKAPQFPVKAIDHPGVVDMTLISLRAAAPRPSIDELVSRADAIRVLVRGEAEQTEANRQVSVEAVERMRRTGLFRIMQPAVYGGYEYGFDALVRAVAPVASGCGSAGWVFSLGIVHQWLAATFPKQAQDEYWSDPDAIAAGSYAPAGKAVAANGGYRLSGSWSFTSGCDHAQWLFLGGMIPPANEGAPPNPALPKPAFFLLPRGDVRFDDNWHTMGLAGTGSKNTVADDVFVPQHRVVPVADLLAGTTPGALVHDNPLYRQSMLSALPFALVAPILGIADGALADFVEMAKVRTTRGAVAGGNNRMAEFATVQSRVAEATGSIEAARLTVLDALAKATDGAAAGGQADLDLRLRNRLAQAFSVKLLVQAVDALFLASGGQGIFINKPIQRAWRDAHAGAVHVSMNWDAVSTMYGQHALGLDPKGQY
jgi:alkylation response protein AidB-like acyl-CoA dehydrogenase